MKHLIILLLSAFVFSCHKKDDPAPSPKTAELKVIYRAARDHNTVGYSLDYNNAEIQHNGQYTLPSPEYIITMKVEGGKNLGGTLGESPEKGISKDIIVVFNGDTIFKKLNDTGTPWFRLTLPKL